LKNPTCGPCNCRRWMRRTILRTLRSLPLRLTLSSGEAAYRRANFAPAGKMRLLSFDTALARLLRMRV